MISALFISTALAAGPASPGDLISNVRRTFIEDGVDRVSATATHRVISHADGSLELQGPQPLRIWLQSIRRERGASCATDFLSRATALNEPNGVRTLHRCGVEESWTNEADGLAHAFTIAEAPPGTGGLTLRLAIEGPWHHHEERGHVFKGPGAAAALRYGQAFVVRGGQRLPISVLRVEGGLELKIPAALVEAPHAFPMQIDPLLSAELALDSAERYGVCAGREESPAIAVNSAGVALVVWSDTRRQLGIDLFGVRLSATGTVLDNTGLPISLAEGPQLRPTVCADGTNFLVAWDTLARDGGLEVKARTVPSTGALGAQFDVAPGSQPSLAATGDAGLLLLALVDREDQLRVVPIIGNTPDAMLTQLVDSTDVVSRPFIAATHTGWFAAWESATIAGGATSIRGIWSGGLAPPLILSSNTTANSAKRPSVALAKDEFGADEAFVVWNESLGGAKGARINRLGANFPTVVNGFSPAIVRTSNALGAAPVVGSFVANRLQLRDLNDAGLISVVVGVAAQDLALAAGSSNNRVFAAWAETSLGGSDINGTSFVLPSTVNSPVALSTAALAQRSPRVAMSGANKEGLAVWVEGTETILAAKVIDGANGFQVGSPFEVALSGLRIEQVEVAATRDDGKYLVVWREVNSLTMASAIKAQLTSNSSKENGAFTISPSGVAAGPAVAWEQSGANFIVLWNQLNASPELVTKTVTLAGVPSVERPHVQVPAVDVAITCMRGECLLAWERPSQDLEAIVLGSFGSVVSLGAGRRPAVAHDGSNFFMGWSKGTGLGFAKLDYTSGQSTTLAVGPLVSSTSGVLQLSMAPGLPPVVAWSELSALEVPSLFLHRLDFGGQAIYVGQGLSPAISTSDVLAAPVGVVVYQRFAAATRLNTMRSFATAFHFTVDGGADAGVDAGVSDAGSDAGSDGMIDDAGIDAGSMDAGVPDGGSGPAKFGTAGCNCGSASPVPLLCFALLVLRRRRQINAS